VTVKVLHEVWLLIPATSVKGKSKTP